MARKTSAVKVLAGGLISFLLLIVISPRAEAAAPEFMIRLATVAPEESYWGDFALKVKGYIEGRTRGRVKVIWYATGVKGDEPEVIEKIRAGELEGAALTVVGLGLIQPAARVLMLPFIFRGYDEVDYILDSMSSRFESLLEKKGFKLLGFTEIGFCPFFTREPIRTMQDFSRLRVWSWSGDDLLEAVFRDLGCSSANMPLYKTKSALDRGELNSFVTTCYVQPFLEWYRNVEYVSDLNISYTPGAIVINKAYFEKLPADVRYVIEQAFSFMMEPLKQVIREEEARACRGLLKRGIKRYEFTPQLKVELRKRADQIYFRYADDKYPRSLVQEMIDRLNEFRSH